VSRHRSNPKPTCAALSALLAVTIAVFTVFTSSALARTNVSSQRQKQALIASQSSRHKARSKKRKADNLAARIVWAGEHVGGREDTLYKCLKGVEDSLEAIGINFPRLAYARQMGPVIARDKRQFKEISPYSRLRPGDIIVHGGAPANPDGHIAIVLPGGRESSDHIQTLISPLNSSFGRSRVFRPI
jgi:cell wall-associated NlpC family hydrolase